MKILDKSGSILVLKGGEISLEKFRSVYEKGGIQEIILEDGEDYHLIRCYRDFLDVVDLRSPFLFGVMNIGIDRVPVTICKGGQGNSCKDEPR